MEFDFSRTSKSTFCSVINDRVKRSDDDKLEYINGIIITDFPLKHLRTSLSVSCKRTMFEVYDSDGELEDEYEYHVQGSIPKIKDISKEINTTIMGIGFYIPQDNSYFASRFSAEEAYKIIKLEGGVLDLNVYSIEFGVNNTRRYEKMELDKGTRDKIALYLYPYLSNYYKGKTVMNDFLSSYIIAQRDMAKYIASVADKLELLAGCIDELKDYIKGKDSDEEDQGEELMSDDLKKEIAYAKEEWGDNELDEL